MNSLITTCTYDCHDQCSVVCAREDGRLQLRGNPRHPHTHGFTCAKIRRHLTRLTSPHRIREPWLRRDGRFHPVSWDEAMAVAADALGAALDADPASVLWYRGSGNRGASKGFTDFVFGSLGARSTRGGLCDQAGVAALEQDAGTLDMNHPSEIDRADVIVLWGKNPRASSVHLAAQVVRARRRGVPVIAINPDLRGVANLADEAIAIRPGSDRFLALAVIHLLRERGGWRIQPETAGDSPDFSRLLRDTTAAQLLAACDVGTEQAARLAAAYRHSPRVATVVGWGVQRYCHGGNTLRTVHALCFLAGTLGVAGGGLYYSIPSARHLQRPPPLPTRRSAPPLRLARLADDLQSAAPPVRFVWFSCSNYLNQGPDAKRIHAALAEVATVVTVDAFWTETARNSRLVLPSTLWLEEEDLVASFWHNTLGAVRQVVGAPRHCRSDFAVVHDLARRVGLKHPYPTVDHWLRACLPTGVASLAQLRKTGWLAMEHPNIAWQGGFAHADGRFRLLTELPPAPVADSHHPYQLISGIQRRATHSQLLPEEQTAPLPVRVHPDTATRHGLVAGDPVRISSTAGELEGTLHCDPLVHPEAVCCPRGGWLSLGVGINEVTTTQLTDLGEGAAYYDTRVRLEQAAGGAPTPAPGNSDRATA